MQKSRIFTLISVCLLFFSCSSGFESVSTSLRSQNNSSSCSTCSDSNNSNSNIKKLSATLSGGQHNQLEVIHIDPSLKMVTMTIPLVISSVFSSPLQNQTIDQIPGALISVITLSDSTPAVQLQIPSLYLQNSISLSPQYQLPNAISIPELNQPIQALTLLTGKNHNISVSIYLAPQSFGVYVASPFDPGMSMQFNILDESSNRIGGFYTYKYSSGQSLGGYFLGFNLTP